MHGGGLAGQHFAALEMQNIDGGLECMVGGWQVGTLRLQKCKKFDKGFVFRVGGWQIGKLEL